MIDSEMVSTPGGLLHVRVLGAGPPVLLLHGFPDSSLGFRELCEALAARGFRAVAPDLLGYGMSDKPRGLAPYRVDAAVADLAALARWAGGKVAVLGHGSGGTLAYCFAAKHPELVSKLVVLSAVHPELGTGWRLAQSGYVLFFQLRKIAEWVVTRRRVFHWMMRRRVARPERLTEARVEAARRELLRPGAATAALSYFRAAFRWPVRCVEPIRAPALLLAGGEAPDVDALRLPSLEPYLTDARVQRIGGAGHFLHWDEPERVAEAVTVFLR